MKNKIKFILSLMLIFFLTFNNVIISNAAMLNNGITVLDVKGPYIPGVGQCYSWSGFQNMHDYRCHNYLTIEGHKGLEAWGDGIAGGNTYYPYHQWVLEALLHGQ